MAWVLQTGDKNFIQDHTDPFGYSNKPQPKEMYYGGGYPPDAVNVPDDRFVEDMTFAHQFATKEEANEKRDGLMSDYKVKFHTIPS